MTTTLAGPPVPQAPPGSAADRAGGDRSHPGPRGGGAPARLRAAWTTRAAQLGLWGLVVVGATAGVAALALQLHQPADTPSGQTPVSSTPAEGFAELYVAAFLAAGEGGEDALEPFYAEPVDLTGVEAGSVWVQHATAVEAEPQGAGRWAVTVAVELLLAEEGGWRPGGRRFYQVGVIHTPEGLAATSLPGRVAAPPVAEGLPDRTVKTLGGAGLDAEPVRTAERFLAAYLAGEGDVARYTAPGLDLAPLDPPGYAEVAVRRAGRRDLPDGLVLVGVEVAAVDDAGRVEVAHYWLALVERSGRWEVARLHPAAPLSPAGES